jgi:hypothetical protein
MWKDKKLNFLQNILEETDIDDHLNEQQYMNKIKLKF